MNHNYILQEYIDIIAKEGRLDDLLKLCSYYHNAFDSDQEAIEWGFLFGKHITQSFKDQEVQIWRFAVPYSKTVLYFIGSYDVVRNKIFDAL